MPLSSVQSCWMPMAAAVCKTCPVRILNRRSTATHSGITHETPGGCQPKLRGQWTNMLGPFRASSKSAAVKTLELVAVVRVRLQELCNYVHFDVDDDWRQFPAHVDPDN